MYSMVLGSVYMSGDMIGYTFLYCVGMYTYFLVLGRMYFLHFGKVLNVWWKMRRYLVLGSVRSGDTWCPEW